jgi:hypothetical protein
MSGSMPNEVENAGDVEVHEHVRTRWPQRLICGTICCTKDFKSVYHFIERHNRYSNWEARVYHNFAHGAWRRAGTIRSSLLRIATRAKALSEAALGAAAFSAAASFHLDVCNQARFSGWSAGSDLLHADDDARGGDHGQDL